MPGEMTLEDLASDAGITGGGTSNSSSGGGTGEWVDKLIDKLDDKGIVDALIDNQMQKGADSPESDSLPTPTPSPEPQTDGGEAVAQAPEIGAEEIKKVLLEVYDRGGSVPGLPEDPKVSDLIKLIDQYPGMADKLIGEYMGGEQ